MKTAVKVIIGISVLFAALIVTGIITIAVGYISVNDKAAAYESRIEGISDQSRIRLGNHGNTILEMFQVDQAANDHISKVVRESMEGRYGKDGSKAVFQMLTEAQIPITNTIREKIVITIEAGRNSYTVSQEDMIKVVTNYRTDLNTVWFGTMARFAGYPKLDLSKYKGISTVRADSVFEKGVEAGPLDIYKGK